MITQELLPIYEIPRELLFPDTIEQFLDVFQGVISNNIEKGIRLNFNLKGQKNDRFTPVLKLAKPEHAKVLSNICKEVYDGTYPYREMEDEDALRSMIKDPRHHFILFEISPEEFVGCFHCALDFKHKKGYMGGFMLMKPYHSKLDVVKTIIGSYTWMWSTFIDIKVWYCENRGAHTASQYMTAVCGIKTLGILPNKDVFFGELESDVFGAVYSERAFSSYRKDMRPNLIPEALGCYFYADNLYGLGNFRVESPDLNLDPDFIEIFKQKVRVKRKRVGFGYEEVKISIKGTESRLKALYTRHLSNIERISFTYNTLEQFYALLNKLREIMNSLRVRYCEIFTSAYDPKEQQLLLEFGFTPRGYVPCWCYDQRRDQFEDHLICNWFEQEVSNLRLYGSGNELYDALF